MYDRLSSEKKGSISLGNNSHNDTQELPQTPACKALQKAAGQIGQALQQTADDLGLIASAGFVATAIFGAGEVATGGLDTPGTITAGTFTAAASTGSIITEVAAVGFNSYANGNLNALTSFDVTKLVGLAATLATSRFSALRRFGDTVGDLAERAAGLANEAQAGCQ